MDIEKKKILILGGWGLVGSAIIRKLVQFNPDTIVILSLKEIEAVDVCNELMSEYSQIKFLPEWGNIFVRNSLGLRCYGLWPRSASQRGQVGEKYEVFNIRI